MKLNHLLAFFLGSSILCTACNGSSSQANRPAPGSTFSPSRSLPLMVSTVGDPGLFALHAGIAELRLVAADGRRSENMLPAPTQLELIGLGSTARLLGQAPEGPSVYTGMELKFETRQLRAVDASGQESLGQASQTDWLIDLEAALVLDAADTDFLMLVIDLGGSIPGAGVALPADGFEFELDGMLHRASQAAPVEFRGQLVEMDPENQLLTLQAESSAGQPLGRMQVAWDGATNLFDRDGSRLLDPNAFVNSLVLANTKLRVQGPLGALARVAAERMELLDEVQLMLDPEVEVDGLVQRVDLGAGTFSVLVRELQATNEGTLDLEFDRLNANLLHFRFSFGTRFEGLGGAHAELQDLRPGRRVKVLFSRFQSSPYFVSDVRLLQTSVCLSGSIVSTDGAASEITLLVRRDSISWDDDEDAYRSDEDGDDDSRVLLRVDLSAAEITLDLRDRPALRSEQLSPGLRVKVCGELQAGHMDRIFHADELRVRPGHLIKGEVSAIDVRNQRFTLRSAQIVQPFGDSVSGAPLGIELNQRARFLQDAASASEFFRLFSGLADDELLEVKLKGIAAAALETIEAYELKSKLKRRK